MRPIAQQSRYLLGAFGADLVILEFCTIILANVNDIFSFNWNVNFYLQAFDCLCVRELSRAKPSRLSAMKQKLKTNSSHFAEQQCHCGLELRGEHVKHAIDPYFVAFCVACASTWSPKSENLKAVTFLIFFWCKVKLLVLSIMAKDSFDHLNKLNCFQSQTESDIRLQLNFL